MTNNPFVFFKKYFYLGVACNGWVQSKPVSKHVSADNIVCISDGVIMLFVVKARVDGVDP